MSTGCKSSHNGFLDVSRSNGGLTISGWIGQLSRLTIFFTSLSLAAFFRRAGGSMIESTGSHERGVERRVPEMRRMGGEGSTPQGFAEMTPLAPSRRISAQLFRLECVKFIFDVSSSQRCRRAASSDSMRWSAMSGSPDSSYCFSKSWHSSSKHGVYVGWKPRGMEWRAAFCIAPQKR